ncbi:glutamate--cysteine ligase [Marinomonas sp. 42_23_T18]|nr:glutamate--cysteine ligase [Marinomonas sp. 42_23_T18]
MSTSLHHALQALSNHCSNKQDTRALTFHRGIEREALRVNNENGRISHKPHPITLGSALTHKSVTTDYSEALMEFITGVHPSVESALKELDDIHLFVSHELSKEGESLWPASMPGQIEGDADVPIAEYGESNSGKLKHAYRQGLSYRYGRVMQCIAGMHYNFSFDKDFWAFLKDFKDDNKVSYTDLQSESYFALIRNFRRSSWLLPLLFGASPAIDKSFLPEGNDKLSEISPDTLMGPNATSLRMSDLGYSNDAQADLYVCYNEVSTYIQTIRNAIQTPYTEYEKIGVKVDGAYRQLNTNILQIENEYYSDIRPKRVTHAGEHPSAALRDRGVEYIEVRIMDLDPFTSIGMDKDTLYFLDTYLVYCMLRGDEKFTAEECEALRSMQQEAVTQGRDLEKSINFLEGASSIKVQANKLLSDIMSVASTLAELTGNQAYINAVQLQMDKIANKELLPSAKIAQLSEQEGSYAKAMLALAEQHQLDWQAQELDHNIAKAFSDETKDSLLRQKHIEESDEMSFEVFLAEYLTPQ